MSVQSQLSPKEHRGIIYKSTPGHIQVLFISGKTLVLLFPLICVSSRSDVPFWSNVTEKVVCDFNHTVRLAVSYSMFKGRLELAWLQELLKAQCWHWIFPQGWILKPFPCLDMATRQYMFEAGVFLFLYLWPSLSGKPDLPEATKCSSSDMYFPDLVRNSSVGLRD